MLLQIFIVLLLVIPMKVANCTDNMWVSALRALDTYTNVFGKIIGEGKQLFHGNVVDSFVQLAA